MPSLRVVLGEALVDLYADPPGASVSEALLFRAFVGGSGLNVACALAASAVPVRFLGSLSLDPHGGRLLKVLSAAGVDTSLVQRVGRPSPLVFVSASVDGERRFCAHRRETAEAQFSASRLRAEKRDPIEGARWLLLGSDAAVRSPIRSAARWLLRQCELRGVAFAVDLNARPGLWPGPAAARRRITELVRRARVLKASADDLLAMDLEPSLDALTVMAPEAGCVLTRGAGGALVAACGERWAVEAKRVSVVDETGAGDAFFAGMMSVLDPDELGARGHWDRALCRAVQMGAAAVGSRGAASAFVRRGGL